MSGPQKERHVESKKAAYTSFGIPAVLLEMVCYQMKHSKNVSLLTINSYRSPLQASSLLSPTLVARLSGLRIWSPPEPLRQASRSRQRRQSEDNLTLVASANHHFTDYTFGIMLGSGPTGTTGDFEAPAYPCLIFLESAVF
jgi:hypothetical protein